MIDGKQPADRRLAQPRDVIRRRPRIAALDDLAAGPCPADRGTRRNKSNTDRGRAEQFAHRRQAENHRQSPRFSSNFAPLRCLAAGAGSCCGTFGLPRVLPPGEIAPHRSANGRARPFPRQRTLPSGRRQKIDWLQRLKARLARHLLLAAGEQDSSMPTNAAGTVPLSVQCRRLAIRASLARALLARRHSLALRPATLPRRLGLRHDNHVAMRIASWPENARVASKSNSGSSPRCTGKSGPGSPARTAAR